MDGGGAGRKLGLRKLPTGFLIWEDIGDPDSIYTSPSSALRDKFAVSVAPRGLVRIVAFLPLPLPPASRAFSLAAAMLGSARVGSGGNGAIGGGLGLRNPIVYLLM